MIIGLTIAGALISAALILCLVRLVQGPGAVDRVVATDVLLSLLVAALAIEAAINQHMHTIPLMVITSMLAFSSTVAMARFVAVRNDLVGRERQDLYPGAVEKTGPIAVVAPEESGEDNS
ncbi:MAG TPA: sodium:proton antiporter [Candidatus Agrococcus pullicola]|uniref:Sodium:proton antiporter n=1 Tax=Candidatus Agrococcus pullicola TaxID=2838429 RepID=A0A9D1YSE7_9MICO|nr:sodium:proton antiporter [Candidatus Agrococcus pullicola]